MKCTRHILINTAGETKGKHDLSKSITNRFFKFSLWNLKIRKDRKITDYTEKGSFSIWAKVTEVWKQDFYFPTEIWEQDSWWFNPGKKNAIRNSYFLPKNKNKKTDKSEVKFSETATNRVAHSDSVSESIMILTLPYYFCLS